MSSVGRPIGSKNRRGHSAGGKRKNAGRPSGEQQEQEQNEAAERARRMHDQRQSISEADTLRVVEAERLREENKERKMSQALKLLRATAIDQRVRDDDWREYEGGDIDGDGGSEKNAPSIEEADEVADYETDDKDKGGGATKERRAMCRNAYIPPPGTPISEIAIILDNTRKRLENPNRTLAQAYRHMWIAPGMDPLSFPGGPGKANR
eukprot:scaffold96542_cov33-Attheya_sp.AAC.1